MGHVAVQLGSKISVLFPAISHPKTALLALEKTRGPTLLETSRGLGVRGRTELMANTGKGSAQSGKRGGGGETYLYCDGVGDTIFHPKLAQTEAGAKIGSIEARPQYHSFVSI
jgi:hypothetical protein